MLAEMSTEEPTTTAPDPALVDQRVILYDVTWEDYERLLAIRGESARPRITYLEGALELMSPSTNHEEQKKTLARLLEAWSDAVGIPLDGIGSWTLKDRRVKRGCEPDECYRRGDGRRGEFPDFAIEVVGTGGGLSKLDVYRKLGVKEVWIWRNGALAFHILGDDGRYALADLSQVVPELDPELIARCMAEPTQLAALRSLRDALAQGTPLE
jgi:Uma2 family endonuclease